MKKILIVEDHKDNAYYIKCILGEKDYKLDFAITGREALHKCESVTYDLILLDIALPDIPGDIVAQRIKDNPKLIDIPLVAYTANIMDPSYETFFSAILSKPALPDEVRCLIKEMTENE